MKLSAPEDASTWICSANRRCARRFSVNMVAGGLGFEPRLAESESAVLPLDDPPSAGSRSPSPAKDRRSTRYHTATRLGRGPGATLGGGTADDLSWSRPNLRRPL